MRRPTPLPPSAESSAGSEPAPSSSDAPAPDAPVAAGGSVTKATRSNSLAPVIPLDAALSGPPEGSDASAGTTTPMRRPTGLPDGHTRGTGDPDRNTVEIAGIGDASHDMRDPVRLRDVWGAARARRKALRAEVRRFTGRQRRRRMLWLGAAASVVLLVLATLGAAYSPLFALEQVRIVGSEDLDTLAVESALGDQLGTPLPLIDESAVKAALVAFPLIESYSLEARPPHELVVRIVERTPIGLVQTRAGYTLVDAAGVALSTTQTPAPGRPVLTVEGGTNSPAFESVGQVMRSLPDSILQQVTAVSASTPDDVTFTLGGSNAQVVWGSADQSALKATNLETIMISRPPAAVYLYDVSSPNAIVVR